MLNSASLRYTMFSELELLWKKDAKRRILTLFKAMFWELELLRKFWKKGRQTAHSDAVWNDDLEVQNMSPTKYHSIRYWSINSVFKLFSLLWGILLLFLKNLTYNFSEV